jgi:hypothetical protein
VVGSAGAVSASVALFVACGGEQAGVSAAKLPEGVRSNNIEHEACDESGHKVETLDANNDGKPDIRRVFDGAGHELCRIADMNHDGKPDMYEYFDASGQIRRREIDLGEDGVISVIEYYEGGKLARKELDAARRGKIDTWDFYDVATGKRVKRERDTNGDGRVDQWWTWEGDKVTIAMDRNFDGQPELESQVVLGGEGAVTKDGGASLTSAAGDAAAAEPAPAAASDAGLSPSPTYADGGPGGAIHDGGARRRGGKR